jgi:hypothetical protein
MKYAMRLVIKHDKKLHKSCDMFFLLKKKRIKVLQITKQIICFYCEVGKTQRRETATEYRSWTGATRSKVRFLPTDQSGALHVKM